MGHGAPLQTDSSGTKYQYAFRLDQIAKTQGLHRLAKAHVIAEKCMPPASSVLNASTLKRQVIQAVRTRHSIRASKATTSLNFSLICLESPPGSGRSKFEKRDSRIRVGLWFARVIRREEDEITVGPGCSRAC
jgi:hypothetical protein